MKTRTSITRTTCSKTIAGCLRTAWAGRLLPLLLLLLALPAVVQAQYNYTANNGTVTITKYTGAASAVTIPSTIDGLPVTTIGAGAFEGCSSLTIVTIPNSVTSIKDHAFSGCSSLPSITIPDSVTSIGDYAFTYCGSLTGVYFKGNAPNVGLNAFAGEYNATVCYLAGTTGWGPTFGGRPTMLWKPLWKPLVQPYTYTTTNGKVTITKYIGPGGAVTISDTINGLSVTSIGNGAFGNCSRLTSVIIPNSVTNIGNGAFGNCPSLTSVTIDNRVTSIGLYAFWNCTSLRGVYFKGNAPRIDSNAFSGANNATVYYLPGTTGWETTFGVRPTMLRKP